jgi:hypothetical protein
MWAEIVFVISTLAFAIVYPISAYPLQQTVEMAKDAVSKAAPVQPTGLNKTSYLETIAGIVHYFKEYQSSDGAIIDPYEHKEIQYSTPCYAHAAATLIATGYNKNNTLLESASRALTKALTELAENMCAEMHCNFFTMPCMFAYILLKNKVDKQTVSKWDQLAAQIDPEKVYYNTGNNWGVVALTGEYLRYKLGFSNSTTWLENELKEQFSKGHFTANGQYQDRSGYGGHLNPMPYDHFPRKYLAVMMERGYNLSLASDLQNLLDIAAWVSLLLQSPWGELPTGGRSSQHQWNEAVQTVTYELYANKSAMQGDMVSALAFKRAAHLAHASVRRWRRNTNDLFIVKNRFDPSVRHGFESYSFHSNYNLLPASMLATAYFYANDSIMEGPSPADVGGFAFEIPDFHKIIVNVAGMYLEIETDADPHYDSTGLTRVHAPGVEPLIMPTAGSAQKDGSIAIGLIYYDGQTWSNLSSVGYLQNVTYKLNVMSINTSYGGIHIDWDISHAHQPYRTFWQEYYIYPDRVEVINTTNPFTHTETPSCVDFMKSIITNIRDKLLLKK